MLKVHIKLAMINDKVHEMIPFKQNEWLFIYWLVIKIYTQIKRQVTDDFKKDFYKKHNNAVFGNTIENVRNRIKIKIIENDVGDEITKQQSKPTFNEIHKFLQFMIIIHLSKKKFFLANHSAQKSRC